MSIRHRAFPDSTATRPDANCGGSHLSTFLQEHDARGVTTASKPNAIYVYDWARWRSQYNGVESICVTKRRSARSACRPVCPDLHTFAKERRKCRGPAGRLSRSR
jgi:hypothetical protein